jgi:hypothetical protein
VAAVVVLTVAVEVVMLQLCLMLNCRSVKKRDRATRWRLRGVGWEL